VAVRAGRVVFDVEHRRQGFPVAGPVPAVVDEERCLLGGAGLVGPGEVVCAADDALLVGVDVVVVERGVGVVAAAGRFDVGKIDSVACDRIPVDVALPVADVDPGCAGRCRGGGERLPVVEGLVFRNGRPGVIVRLVRLLGVGCRGTGECGRGSQHGGSQYRGEHTTACRAPDGGRQEFCVVRRVHVFLLGSSCPTVVESGVPGEINVPITLRCLIGTIVTIGGTISTRPESTPRVGKTHPRVRCAVAAY